MAKKWTKKLLFFFTQFLILFLENQHLWLHKHDLECIAILCPAVCVSDVTNVTMSALQFCAQQSVSVMSQT